MSYWGNEQSLSPTKFTHRKAVAFDLAFCVCRAVDEPARTPKIKNKKTGTYDRRMDELPIFTDGVDEDTRSIQSTERQFLAI